MEPKFCKNPGKARAENSAAAEPTCESHSIILKTESRIRLLGNIH